MRRLSGATGLLGSFAAVTLAHLVAHAGGVELAQQLTKPLLMPLLAAWAWARGGPRLLVVALLFGWGGDLALQSGSDSVFLLGMASFAVGHLCYLTLFRRLGRLERSRLLALGTLYGTACAVLVTLLWPGLDADLALPVAGYSLLLTAMACVAAVALGWRAGLGGALFLFSDALIGGGLADWQELPAQGLLIMATYIAAQYLLASAVLRAAVASSELAGPAPGRLNASAR